MLLALAASVIAAEPAIEVMTFNTWGLPAPVARGREERFPRIARFLEASGAEIVGLEEVWWGARALFGELQGLALPRGADDTGLALYTTLPVDHLDAHPFEAERGIDALKAKGVLHARVLHPTGPVEVFVTHLQAGAGGANARTRAAQIEELLQHVGGVDGPVVLMGDLNLYADEPVDQASADVLVAAGLVDAAAGVGAAAPTYAGSSHRFDQVWVGQGLTPTASQVLEWDAQGALSDHLPLIATLAVDQ